MIEFLRRRVAALRRHKTTSKAVPTVLPLLLYWGRRGGGARYTYELSRALSRRTGVAGLSVSINRDNELASKFLELGSDAKISVDFRDFGRDGWRTLIALVPGPWSFGAACARRRQGVIVTMGDPLTLLLTWTLRSAHVPYALVVHDAQPHSGDGGVLVLRALRRAARNAEAVVALSESVAGQIRAGWSVAADRITVIPHGPFYADADDVSRDAIHDMQRPDHDSPTYLLFGRIRAYKGVKLLLEAWESFAQIHPTAHLVIAGEGSLEDCTAILNRIPSGRVSLRNSWIPDSDVVRLFDDASVVVLPYTDASQSGVIGIAHARGALVVSTDVGGLPEQIKENDILVTPTVDGILRGLIDASLKIQDRSASNGSPQWDEIASELVRTLGVKS
jgi:glycosyltransferase involved in cell wall biosynthesis